MLLLHSPLPRTVLGCVRAQKVPRAILQGFIERTAGNGREGVFRSIVHSLPPRGLGRLWGCGHVDVVKVREAAENRYRAGVVLDGFELEFEE